ncbi:hypothetical protein VTL71DRAFT_10900 [Oculimacula yallundae]|uniref:Uncharacterized protein n=1 Tax=Oculimacula yallundae TaxID=86028 RepID=A0ABR4CUJ9_9HELO
MAMSTENTPPNSPPKLGATVAPTPQKRRPSPLRLQSEAEKNNILTQSQFPAFLPTPKAPNSTSTQKSKSLTSAELASTVLSSPEVHQIGTTLQSEAAPMSLQEARQRRESIKDERKKSIEFIRRRTISRAAVGGRPSKEMLEKLVEPKWDVSVRGEEGEGDEDEDEEKDQEKDGGE